MQSVGPEAWPIGAWPVGWGAGGGDGRGVVTEGRGRGGAGAGQRLGRQNSPPPLGDSRAQGRQCPFSSWESWPGRSPPLEPPPPTSALDAGPSPNCWVGESSSRDLSGPSFLWVPSGLLHVLTLPWEGHPSLCLSFPILGGWDRGGQGAWWTGKPQDQWVAQWVSGALGVMWGPSPRQHP